ncbi:MAG: 2-dehydropantoate 2-reductase [Xanthobacteraceae bacterium]|nr:2-dehydropantoate 2-reductase [Xanthobacteraceae bacterium]
MTNWTWSNIAVVGAGALGSYFGGLLARAGNRVTLIGRAGHVDAIRRNGLLLQSHGTDERIPVSATTDISSVRDAGLVLFCVKSLDTETAAAAMAPHLAPDAIMLSLQNGVDNPERIGLHVRNQVVPVLVYAGANIPEPGTVRHTGGGQVVIGQLKTFRAGAEPDRGLLAGIAALFAGAGVTVKVSDDIEADLWIKLLMNCTYNAISALGRSAYGRMVATPEVNAVMREAAGEVAAVAKARGIRLPDDIVETAMKLADAMPQTMSSTAQDIAKGRPTEVAYLNGYVMRQGEKLGTATPVNRTLNALIELLEQSGADR